MKNIEINRQQPYYRFFEILPGTITWLVFIVPVVLSLYAPKVLASIVIVYAIYWLLKALIMSYRLIVGYKQYQKDITINWSQRCKTLGGANDIYHVVIMAEYKEPYKTLLYSIEAIARSKHPLDKIIFVLASEERGKEVSRPNAKKLKALFGDKFFHFAHFEHPSNLPNEVVGKGANMYYAAQQILPFLDKHKIDYNNVIVTTFDADHRPHEQYFSALTYAFLTSPDAKHKSFQPLPMFFNNIWDVPIPVRSIATGSSFWQIIESTKPYRLRNFAAHAQPLSALIETDFWSRLTIVEDGHQFWRSYFRFDGNHEVVPVNIPIYQDAVLSPKSYYHTFEEQYLQKKRWAWGCSDIPYLITNCMKNNLIPWQDKVVQIYRLVEGHISWSTTSIVLFFAGWLPMIINPEFKSTVVAFNFPFIYSRILTFATIGMIVTLSISTLMLPPKPKKDFNLSVFLEWVMTPFILPFSNIIFSSIPAVHAQTLLMMGKYMGFRVTEKKAVKYERMRK